MEPGLEHAGAGRAARQRSRPDPLEAALVPVLGDQGGAKNAIADRYMEGQAVLRIELQGGLRERRVRFSASRRSKRIQPATMSAAPKSPDCVEPLARSSAASALQGPGPG